ncbi:restriction endonuclease subunit S [Spiroplasma endosymbiont of Polydrusus pterygomalis]|uniref:restriction endonuclease subunit S n=2 Tax=Spiroplasma endosymbiont of Polydrusus pterygomalis TaxID=3139327 RepID=UPI003CCB3B7C
MNKSLVPKIRFKGFNDFYYKTTFNKFYNKGKSGGTPSTKNKDFYNGEISFLSIKDVTNQGKYIFETEKTITRKGLLNSSAWLVPKNSLIYSIYASVGFPTINKIPLATSQAFFSMEINNLYFSIEYLYYLLLKFKKKELNKYIIKQTQPNLSKEIINQFIFKLPNLQEQNKIADFFTIIDKKIELVKEQLSLLTKQKQYYLNNMFANEKGYPQIRFKGFNDEWVLKQVQEVLTTIKSLKIKKNFESNTKLPLISQKKDFIDSYIKKGNLVEQLPIILFGDHTTILKYLDKYFFVADDGIKLLELSNSFKNFNLKFIYYSVLLNNVSQSGYKRHFLMLKNVFISLTNNINEQTKIAHFFTIIDRKIELIKEQLSLLTKQKQYYLNNMFI